MLEQRVRHHLDLVKVNAFIQLRQPRRQKRRNKMHIMAPLCQVAAELRAHNAAAAIGRIDCNADIHKSLSSNRIWYHAVICLTKLLANTQRAKWVRPFWKGDSLAEIEWFRKKYLDRGPAYSGISLSLAARTIDAASDAVFAVAVRCPIFRPGRGSSFP